MAKKESIELEVEIYEGNGEVGSDFNRDNVGMVYFAYEGNLVGSRGNSPHVARMIAIDLEESIIVSRKVDGVKLRFYDGPPTSKSTYIDGYFGRPVGCSGAVLLKALQERRRIRLRREIEKLSSITDRKGRKITLMF